jgi:hypothetical protein
MTNSLSIGAYWGAVAPSPAKSAITSWVECHSIDLGSTTASV